MALRDFFRLKGHFREIAMNNAYLSRGHFCVYGNIKRFSFYAESGDGEWGTDYFIEIGYTPEDGVTYSESHCGRTRGCFWTDPEEFNLGSDGFWTAVLEEVRRFGGLEAIWPSRIGSQER